MSEEMEIRGWQFPSSHSSERRMNSEASIRRTLEEADYKVDFCKVIKKCQIFGSRKEMVDWLEGTLTANWNIPYGYQREFFEEKSEPFYFHFRLKFLSYIIFWTYKYLISKQ